MAIAITLRELHYLVAVADHGHFARAAEACYVTQPTLSTQLKKLEDYLGVQVFERSKKGVVQTPAGRKIVAQARVVLAESYKLMDIARQAADPYAGPMRLGVIPTLGPYLLPLVLPLLRERFPQLKLYLREDLTVNLLRGLKGGDLDAALVALPVREPELWTRSLFREPFTLAVPPGFALPHPAPLCSEELHDLPMLLLEEGHCLREQALAVCGQPRAQEDGDFRATSLETLRQMVAGGVGTTLLPVLATNGHSSDNGMLKLVELAPPVPSREIGLAWRRSYPRDRAIEGLASVIRDSLPLGSVESLPWEAMPVASLAD